MSELDNGADIRTPLTIYREKFETIKWMTNDEIAEIFRALEKWMRTGEIDTSKMTDNAKDYFEEMRRKHHESVLQHRANKEKQRARVSKRWQKVREETDARQDTAAYHGNTTVYHGNTTAIPTNTLTNTPTLTLTKSESVTLTRTRAREESEGGEETYPTEEMVLAVAREHQMDEQFVLSWWQRMQASSWRDTKGKKIPIGGWRAKLAYAWRDEQTRRKEGGGRRKGEPSNIHHDPTVEVENAF